MAFSSHAATQSLTEQDAAPYTGYTPAAFRAWRREGRGPAFIRVGRSIRYLTRDLDAWLDAHRVDTGATSKREGAR